MASHIRFFRGFSIIGLILICKFATETIAVGTGITSPETTSINDISSILLNHWHDGHDIEITSSYSVHLQSHNSWWIQGLADNQEPGGMDGLALNIEFTVSETGFKALQLYQTTDDCETVIAKPIVIYVKFVHTLNNLIVPLSAFPNVDRSCVYAIVFHGPLTLRNIFKIDESEAYSDKSLIPTAEISIFDPNCVPNVSVVVFFDESNVNAGGGAQVHLTEMTGVLEEEDMFDEYLAGVNQCIDISNKMIRIIYSSESDALRKVTFEHKRFTCEDDNTWMHSSYFMFMSGNQKQLLVPATAFPRSNPSLAYALMILGPLTIHKVEIVHEAITLPIPHKFEYVSSDQSPLHQNKANDQYSDQRVTRLEGMRIVPTTNHGWINSGVSNPSSHKIGQTKFLISCKDQDQMSRNHAFRITYSAQHSFTSLVTLLERQSTSEGPRPSTLTSRVMFFAGTKMQIMVPIAMFTKVDALVDLSTVYGLGIDGNLQICDIELIWKDVLMSAIDLHYDGRPNAVHIYYSAGYTGTHLVILKTGASVPFALSIMFPAGKYCQIIIPIYSYLRPDQTLLEIEIRGSIIVHSLSLVRPYDDGLIRTTISPHVRHFIKVHRASLVKDARSQILELEHGFYIKLAVIFDGENGIYVGGLGREFFSLISKEIFAPVFDLFTTSNDTNEVLHINPNSSKKDGYLDDFRFVGRIIGFAITNRQVLGVNFGTPILKYILGRRTSIKDLNSIDPQLYRHLISLKTIDVSNLDLSMEGLINGGGMTDVTETNKEWYIKLYAEVRLWRSIQEQIKALQDGVNSVVPNGQLSDMSISRLRHQLQGAGKIDVNDWKLHTEYDKDNPVVQWFWRCVEEFNDLKQGLVLKFATGSPYAPFEGFSKLNGGKFTIKLLSHQGDKHHPSSHTCINTIGLPAYGSYDILRSRLEFAIEEPSSTFGVY